MIYTVYNIFDSEKKNGFEDSGDLTCIGPCLWNYAIVAKVMGVL